MHRTPPSSDSLRPDLRAAFEATEYRVQPGRRVLVIRIGRPHPGLDRQLRHRPWAVITPCNPGAQRLDAAWNRQRLHDMRHRLEQEGLEHWPAINHDPRGEWPDEPGWLVVDIDLATAVRLGADWGQLAVVAADPGEPAGLLTAAT